MSQGIKERVINFLRGKFKIVVFDEVAMLQRRVYRFTGLKIVTLIGGAVLLVFILAVVLATQTGILRVLGRAGDVVRSGLYWIIERNR